MFTFFLLSAKFTSWLKVLSILAFSSIKFIFAPPISIEYGFNLYQTIIITTLGGIFGVLFFYYLSKFLIYEYKKNKYSIFYILRLYKIGITPRLPSEKKIFTKQNRYIVRVSKRHGIMSIAMLTPIFLSIPLGSFIAARYFIKYKYTPLYLVGAVIFWSFIVSTTYLWINPF